jgi:hypothetical protein
VTNQGLTFSICTKGIIGMVGDDTEPQLLSEKVSPVFDPDQLNMTQQANMVAGRFGERVVFSLARAGSTPNNLTLEMHPGQGWIVPHSFGLSAATLLEKSGASTRTAKLYGGAANSGYVYDVFTGGSDDGSAISARMQIRWFELSRGNKVRFRKLITNGRGDFSLYFKVDYDSSAGELHPISITETGATWGGGGLWGSTTLTPTVFQGYAESYSLGWGRSFSIEIQESSTSSATGPKLLDDGTAETIGAFSVYGFSLQYQDLGFA